MVRRPLRPRSAAALALLVAIALPAVALPGTQAAFSGVTANGPSGLSAAPDLTAPAVDPTVLVPFGAPDHIQEDLDWSVYAGVTDSGNPASGVATVTADLTAVPGGAGAAVPLLPGSWSYGARGFSHATAAQAHGALPDCSYPYTVTATDGAGWSRTTSTRVMVDRQLLADANLRVTGTATGGEVGYAVAGAGDVNGDGLPDALVGSVSASPRDQRGAGAAWVVFGRSTPGTVDLEDLGAGGFRISGAAVGDRAGAAVAGAGDVSGDGLADVLVGAPGADPGGREGAGSVFLVFGSASADDVHLSELSGRGARVDGAAAGDAAGTSVAGLGDADGDGRPDLAVGAPGADPAGRAGAGAAHVVFGAPGTAAVDLAGPGARGFRVAGAAAGDAAGTAVAAAGDVGADGLADLLVGTPDADPGGRAGAGGAAVVAGRAAAVDVDLAALGTGGYRIDGAAAGDRAGAAVAGTGDVDGDARPDALLGAPGADPPGRAGAGGAHLVPGAAGTAPIDLAAAPAGFRIDGAAAGDAAGTAVAAAGDADADGVPDLLVGAPAADPAGRIDAGAAYLVHGGSGTAAVDLGALGAGGLRIAGAQPSDRAGTAVGGAGDLDGDGRADVLVGAPGADPGTRVDGGTLTAVFPAGADVDLAALGVGGFQVDGARWGGLAGSAVADAGDVNGDGRRDVLVAAPLADRPGRADAGAVYVVFGRTGPAAVDVAALGAGGYRIDGAGAGDLAGTAVAPAGDVNGDGLADALVGAPGADPGGRDGAGAVYVVHGKATGAAVDLAALGAGGSRIAGAAAGDALQTVAGLGDVDGDTVPDALVGAPLADPAWRTDAGRAYVVHGTGGDVDLAALGAGGWTIDGAGPGDRAGAAVAAAGDLDADGLVDLLVGAPLASPGFRFFAGSAFVVDGQAGTAPLDLAAMGGRGYRIDGAGFGDAAGHAVAAAGDVDGDGVGDLLVGAPLADAAAFDGGAAYVLHGGPTTTVDLAALAGRGYRIAGDQLFDRTGSSLAGLGDVNGDGRSDVLVGVPLDDNNLRGDNGTAAVVFGRAAGQDVVLDQLGTGGYLLFGAAGTDSTGFAVAAGGDRDGDGRPDVLVGAPEFNGDVLDVGAVYEYLTPACDP